jgi:hypothetical protein
VGWSGLSFPASSTPLQLPQSVGCHYMSPYKPLISIEQLSDLQLCLTRTECQRSIKTDAAYRNLTFLVVEI